MCDKCVIVKNQPKKLVVTIFHLSFPFSLPPDKTSLPLPTPPTFSPTIQAMFPLLVVVIGDISKLLIISSLSFFSVFLMKM